jgi:hypothetical protein
VIFIPRSPAKSSIAMRACWRGRDPIEGSPVIVRNALTPAVLFIDDMRVMPSMSCPVISGGSGGVKTPRLVGTPPTST